MKITEEELEKIKNLEGKARGQTIKNALQSVLIMEKEEGLAKLEEKLKELGYWLDIYKDYKKINTFAWYPLWYDLLPIIIAADLFGWNEEKIKQFGMYNQKVSFFEKILLKYFISLKIVFEETRNRWRRNYSVGDLEPVEFHEKEKYAILRLKNFLGHPVFCLLLSGYFESAASFVTVSRKVITEETKCPFRGDAYHEYLIKWE